MRQWMSAYMMIVVVIGLIISFSTIVASHAANLPGTIRAVIEQEFPGAEIGEVEKEIWKGEVVTEVEVIATDGKQYELFISEDGRIVKAQEEDGGLPFIGGELSVGLAARGEREIYRDVGSEINPALFFRYENGPVEIQAYDGLQASLNLLGNSTFTLGVNASVDFGGGYDADDSDYFKGMDELDTLYSVGLELEGMFGGWIFQLDASQDVSGEHDGQEVELTLGYEWAAGGFDITPSISVAWLSEDYVDYFYGVSASEARADRPVYAPGSSYELGLELMVTRDIGENWKGVLIGGISTFGDDIKDSPLVDEDYEIEGVIGLMYTF